MKKLLIATTALVGTASVAAADITFSGYGRFGIQYNENNSRLTYGSRTTAEIIEGIDEGSAYVDIDEQDTLGVEVYDDEGSYQGNWDDEENA